MKLPTEKGNRLHRRGSHPNGMQTQTRAYLTMLKPGIGATEDTLRESAAARIRAQPRRQSGCRHRAVQRQQRQSCAAPELHRHPAHRHSPSITDPAPMRQRKREQRSGDRYLEKHGARRAADAARPAKGAERAAAADRLAADATRAAARKQVEAISPRVPGTEAGEGEVRGQGNRGARFRRRGNAMRRRRRHGLQDQRIGGACFP